MTAGPSGPLPGEPAEPPRSRVGRRIGLVVAVVLLVVLVVVALRPSLLSLPSHPSAPLTVQIAATPSRAYAPVNVELAAQVQGGQGPYTYLWTQGATVLGKADQILVTYNAPGNQSVSLQVVDATGTRATATSVVQVISPAPEARAYVPAAGTGDNVVLTIRWHAASAVSACLLPAWGTLDVPMFAQCPGAGGTVAQGTGSAFAFQPDPDDPEVTPLLFQSANPGIAIQVAWWYNTTAAVDSSGSVALTTAVTPL